MALQVIGAVPPCCCSVVEPYDTFATPSCSAGVTIVIPLSRTLIVMAAAADVTPGFELSVAVNVARYEFAIVGVPLRSPVVLRVMPAGRLVADHV